MSSKDENEIKNFELNQHYFKLIDFTELTHLTLTFKKWAESEESEHNCNYSRLSL